MGRRENGGDVHLVEGSDFLGGWGEGDELFSPWVHFLWREFSPQIEEKMGLR